MRHIKLQKGADGIAVLTLDNADESMNIVTDSWLAEMSEAIAEVKADDAVKGLVITSGKTAFMAGADLKLLVDGYGKLSRREAYAFSQRASAMHRALETMGKPVAAAINGLCLGGGFELALACHFRVLVEHPKAVVGLPEVNVGLLPGSGGTQRLPRIAGVKAALDLLLSGRLVKPAEALKLKVIDAIVTTDELITKAKALILSAEGAEQVWDRKGFVLPESRGMVLPEAAATFTMATAGVAGKSGYNLPAPVAILSCVFEGVQLPFDRALSVESKYFATLLTDPVARNIIRTSFISKQGAEKGARRPEGFDKKEVRKVGILGAGMMGAGIALVAAQAGIEVVLIDRDVAAAERGKDYAVKVLGKAVEKGRSTQASADAVLARIRPTDDYGQLSGAELIIEAVFEDIGIKADVTRKAEAVVPPTAIFATNTSTLPITGLAEASVRPGQFIGLHFFSPVERMQLVEVILGKATAPETLARSLDFVAQIRKTPIVVNDSRGFYTSRVFQMLIHEGAAMLADGIKPALIENAARSAGLPVGPLALLDEVTIDLPLKIVQQAIEQEGSSFVPPAGTPVMQRMQALGRSSRKSGGAFYDYPEGGKKQLWKGLSEVFPPSASQPDLEELKKRFLYAQAMETARCLEEGVLETPQDADLGAVYGWGFPLWTGGTISYIDTVGIERFVAEADMLAQRYGARFLPSPWLREKAARGEGFYADTVAAKILEPACAA
ncbi:3-hydroxyacyl-CoA dehydrogenase NAD-binding domain-containing protein [Sphingosinicella sp. LY1275]|uniref:3-hydroxyacyl-CoA dehydrogenase NAD-binding domain-containing protein n=1 Tax=Sphingosinicella sp. LY1275 TaxID=3095379 RepID=UPI002ADEC110|nr:3-hydroxyacyl-CoA dehydrogenase NAD-binding domain-containing protein [Sphingosinicella sp. LY1275]MEA1015245.1 3-hydroxyacyl-CoA dehydrogenase NAD-binding domain-containing protein [Sphingosinicella sp. LY1275]